VVPLRTRVALDVLVSDIPAVGGGGARTINVNVELTNNNSNSVITVLNVVFTSLPSLFC
jgi:hypothetical protein